MAGTGKANRVSDIAFGRKILLKENPKRPVRSQSAKKLVQTVNRAKKGLTAGQANLWRRMVYTPALFHAKRFCTKWQRIEARKLPRCKRSSNPRHVRECKRISKMRRALYGKCVNKVLNSGLKIDVLHGTKRKWTWINYLVDGAAILMQLVSKSHGCEPQRREPAPTGTIVRDLDCDCD